MIETPLLIMAAACTFVSAAWLHEWTHAMAARALGGEVIEMNLTQLYVDFRFPEPSPRRTRLVLLAPAIVGFAIAPIGAVLLAGQDVMVIAVAVVAWVIYALAGGTQGEITLIKPKSSGSPTCRSDYDHEGDDQTAA